MSFNPQSDKYQCFWGNMHVVNAVKTLSLLLLLASVTMMFNEEPKIPGIIFTAFLAVTPWIAFTQNNQYFLIPQLLLFGSGSILLFVNGFSTLHDTRNHPIYKTLTSLETLFRGYSEISLKFYVSMFGIFFCGAIFAWITLIFWTAYKYISDKNASINHYE